MNPSQRILYRRYRDVVLNDNTAKTNRFNMPLNVFVVVDTDGKSRAVAYSLVGGETTQDYEWILRQLLEANDGCAPNIIIVDEDPAMEAACSSIIGDTVLINCIWHIGHQNLARNLRGPLAVRWNSFISAFWAARNSITEPEFERQWTNEILPFGEEKPAVQAYLGRVYDRRRHWAWPWVGTKFTAGMQSTQRVENVHAILKSQVHSKTSLQDLFRIIEEKISDTKRNLGFLRYRADTNRSHIHNDFIDQLFAEVERVNTHFLGTSARYQMTMEMIRSIRYESCPHEFDFDDDIDFNEHSDDDEDSNTSEQTDDDEDINSNDQVDDVNCEVSIMLYNIVYGHLYIIIE
jgi:hypothetical protein